MPGELPLLKPALFARRSGGGVSLSGGRCSACGVTFFPMQARGCERCGAHGDALRPADLGDRGKLISAAKVHVHSGKGRTAPFTVGVVELDSGPRVRTLLDGFDDPERASGSVVVATLCETAGEDGAPALDLRFRPV